MIYLHFFGFQYDYGTSTITGLLHCLALHQDEEDDDDTDDEEETEVPENLSGALKILYRLCKSKPDIASPWLKGIDRSLRTI